MFIKNYQKIDRNKGILEPGGKGCTPHPDFGRKDNPIRTGGGGADNAPRIFSFITIPKT